MDTIGWQLALGSKPSGHGEAKSLTLDIIEPHPIFVAESALVDLRERLNRIRWPDREPVGDWSQGSPLAKVQALCAYWRESYDWRRCEAMLNGWGSCRTVIDGLGIHFLHIRSPEPDALPMILTHGWPGSIIEFHKVIGPLTNPRAHGGDPADAFHLVIPSIPGYGFSDKPESTGWGIERIAGAWIELMRRLGYRRYVAQGGDWGAAITTQIALARPPECAAVHLNMPVVEQRPSDDLSPMEQAAIDDLRRTFAEGAAYSQQQATRPQTLGYGLADSPAGQAAWIYEKLHAWTDNPGAAEQLLSMDEMLDNIMLYWLPNAATSSARLYWESLANGFIAREIEMPIGVSIFPKEMLRASRRWAEIYYHNIIHWNELDRGGHFAAFEQPKLFVSELRNCFRVIR